jgi:integrase
MSVWKDRNGKWHAGLQRDGARLHRTCETRQEAKDIEASWIRDFRSSATGQVLIGAVIQRWLLEEVKNHKARKSTESNAYALADWVEGKPISKVVEVAKEYKAFQRGRLANASINRRLAVLKRIARLSYIEWGYLPEPLHLKIQLLPENNARHVYLTREQFLKSARNLKGPARAGVMLAVYTGMRRSEIMSLKPESIVDGSFLLGDTKTGKPRMVPIHRKLNPYLKRLPLKISQWYLHRVFQRACRKHAGIQDVRFHDLRHTTASMLAQAGVPLFTIGAILGHTQAQTTRRYSHLATDTLKDAIKKIA